MGPRPFVPAELRSRPFTLEQAARAGLTRWQLRSRAWRRLAPQVYAWAGLPAGPLLTLQAVALRLPAGAAFSGPTAAWLHGLDTTPCHPICVAVPPDCTSNRGAGVQVRRARLDATDVVSRQGLNATSMVRTLVDVSHTLALGDAVAVADAALRRRLVREDELLAAAAAPGRPHARCLREVVRLADPRAESPMESWLRVLLRAGGLPKPDLQVDLLDDAGRWVARADMYYASHRLAIEYDGATHRESLVADDRRQNRLLGAGYRLLRFTAPDVIRTPEATLRQVQGFLTGPAARRRAS